jgi:hypothetical protein
MERAELRPEEGVANAAADAFGRLHPGALAA